MSLELMYAQIAGAPDAAEGYNKFENGPGEVIVKVLDFFMGPSENPQTPGVKVVSNMEVVQNVSGEPYPLGYVAGFGRVLNTQRAMSDTKAFVAAIGGCEQAQVTPQLLGAANAHGGAGVKGTILRVTVSTRRGMRKGKNGAPDDPNHIWHNQKYEHIQRPSQEEMQANMAGAQQAAAAANPYAQAAGHGPPHPAQAPQYAPPVHQAAPPAPPQYQQQYQQGAQPPIPGGYGQPAAPQAPYAPPQAPPQQQWQQPAAPQAPHAPPQAPPQQQWQQPAAPQAPQGPPPGTPGGVGFPGYPGGGFPT